MVDVLYQIFSSYEFIAKIDTKIVTFDALYAYIQYMSKCNIVLV